MTTATEPSLPTVEGGIPYRWFGIAALVVLALAMLEKQLGAWSFVPVLFGGASLWRSWRIGPMAILGTLAIALAAGARGLDPANLLYYLIYGGRMPFGPVSMQRLDPLPDLAIAAAILAYVAAHYRLQMIEGFAFPAESLKRASFFLGNLPAEGEPLRRRSATLASPFEIGLLAATLPLWTGLAAVALFWLTRQSQRLTLIDSAWRMPALTFWALAFLLAVIGALTSYQRVASLDRESAQLLLQDDLWRQTRGEQQRIHRWLAWGRLRRQRRKGRQ